MGNFADCASRDGEITTALVWILSKVPGKRDRLLIFRNDPTDRPTFSHTALKLIKTHPSVSTARVQPVDQDQLSTGCGHWDACERVKLTPLCAAQFAYDHIELGEQQVSQFARMFFHMPYATFYHGSGVMSMISEGRRA